MKELLHRVKLFLNRFSRRFFYFLASPAQWKFLAFFLLALVFIAGLLIWQPDYAWNIINTAFGFFLGSIGIYFIDVLKRSTEDYNKVINDSSFIRKRKYDQSYQISFSFNDVTIDDYFDNCYEADTRTIEVIDDGQKYYEPDGLITNSFFDIMKSHGSSYKRNEPTVRLDHFEKKQDRIILYTSRSTYFNHLITNRAIDYFIQGHMTLRDIYEPGPFLTPLKNSKMSNHIGINAFLTIECQQKKYLVLPKRGKTSTISKGFVTSSIASRLVLNNDTIDIGKQANIPFEEQLKFLVQEKYGSCRLEGMEIQFLGFGRNIYEGGKPQFYYSLKTIYCDDIKKYWTQLDTCKQDEEQLDHDVGFILIDLETLKYCNHDVFKATMITATKSKKVCFTVEKSFLANLFLYTKKK